MALGPGESALGRILPPVQGGTQGTSCLSLHWYLPSVDPMRFLHGSDSSSAGGFHVSKLAQARKLGKEGNFIGGLLLISCSLSILVFLLVKMEWSFVGRPSMLALGTPHPISQLHGRASGAPPVRHYDGHIHLAPGWEAPPPGHFMLCWHYFFGQ